MNKISMLLVSLMLVVSGAWFLNEGSVYENEYAEGEFEEENEEEAGRKRAYWEWFISRDPNTGEIPRGIRKRELEWVESISRRSGIQNALTNNTYLAAGPTQTGGRTRALAFDVRYNGTSNRVIIAGGVQGGIFRSDNGGQSWSFVHPANEIRSVTCVAQDPRPGFQNTWYAGTGEAIGMSYYPNAFIQGFGVFRSTDNGLTWTKLNSTVDGTNEFTFDSPFDYCHNIAVHPTTGDVYVAGHRRIMRSQNGGTSWTAVHQGTSTGTAFQGITEILINRAGTRLFAAVSGAMPDRDFAGVWTSATGDAGSWTRIAGGRQNQPDSVAGWRAYDSRLENGSQDGWGRIVLGLSANQTDLYVLIENALSASEGVSEADMFRANTAANPITWSANLGTNLVAKRNGTTDHWMQTQGGYDMEVIGHPTQNNIIYVGGVALYRSTDGFNTKNNNYYMGGNIARQISNTYNDPEEASHVDIHRIRFDPSNVNRMMVASDGGMAFTQDATAAKVTWEPANSQYQTLQYYYVSIDQRLGTRLFLGGAQDNNTSLRDPQGIWNIPQSDTNSHYRLFGGDGGQAYFFRSASNANFVLLAQQEQRVYRSVSFGNPFSFTEITPTPKGDDRFVTYYHLDEDNPGNLYFPANDTLYRTTTAATVTRTTWNRVPSVDQALTGAIFSMATTRGDYSPNSHLFMGTTNGKIFRLKDPANSTEAPVDITPTNMPGNVLVYDLTVNPRNQDTLMAIVSNYNVQSIYWTGNATAARPTWQEIEGNLNLPAVRSGEIIVTNSGVEYYAGTTIGLFSTTSIAGTNTTWSRETGGPGGMMNTGIIQSLAHRWRDNTLVVGTHSNGMFVSYIGNAISSIPTSVNEPIRNDKNFIVNAFPTATTGIINYTTGNMLNIRDIQVQVFNLGGQVVYDRKERFASGRLNVSGLPSGTYVLTITSPDRKYQFVRKFTKS